MYGLAFCFSASVLAFNRGPTLAVSFTRRVFASLPAADVDDLPVIDTVEAAPSANDSLKLVLDKLGYSQPKSKAFPTASHRTLLGASLSFDDVVKHGVAR